MLSVVGDWLARQDGSGEVDFEEFHTWYTSEGDFRKRAQEEQKRRQVEAARLELTTKAENTRCATSTTLGRHARIGYRAHPPHPPPHPRDGGCRGVGACSVAKLEWLRKQFLKLDEDNSGTIDVEEFNVLIQDVFGMKLPRDKLELAMKEIDPDGSGEVSDEPRPRPQAVVMKASGVLW